jgi:nucleoside-diphosphate-sugar epimerase
MPNVLILGATGYLGLTIAKTLLRSGSYHVWGTARTVAKVRLLQEHEIVPVTGDIGDPMFISHIVFSCRINVVVDTTTAIDKDAKTILEGVVHAGKNQLEVLNQLGTSGPKLGYVYTSRAGVHGLPDLPIFGKYLPSDSPEIKAKKAAPRRPAHERKILLSSDALDVAILRPHAMYGRQSPVLGELWKDLMQSCRDTTEPIDVPAEANLHLGVVHVDDVADAFHAAIDRVHGQLGSWPVFDLWAESVRIDDLMEAVLVSHGSRAPLRYGDGIKYRSFETWVLENISDVSHAKTVLGWIPKRVNFIMDLSIYITAWEAAQMYAPQADLIRI